MYYKLPTNGKQLPAFPLEAMTGIEPRPQRWEARVLPLCHRCPSLPSVDCHFPPPVSPLFVVSPFPPSVAFPSPSVPSPLSPGVSSNSNSVGVCGDFYLPLILFAFLGPFMQWRFKTQKAYHLASKIYVCALNPNFLLKKPMSMLPLVGWCSKSK